MANKQFNSVDGYSVGNATVIINETGNVSATSQITRNSRNVPTHVFQANTAPTNALVGDQWYNTENGILFEYLNDGTTLQWVDVSSQPGVIASMTTANTVTNNVQANITSVGTLTSLTVSGTTTLNAISANGSTGAKWQVLSSTGTDTEWSYTGFSSFGQSIISSGGTPSPNDVVGNNILIITGGITITLPNIDPGRSGSIITLKNISGSNVTISFTYAGDGATTLQNNQSAMWISDGGGTSPGTFWRQYFLSTNA